MQNHRSMSSKTSEQVLQRGVGSPRKIYVTHKQNVKELEVRIQIFTVSTKRAVARASGQTLQEVSSLASL